MEDNSDGSVTRSIRPLTQFVVAVTALLGAVLAFTADWRAVERALFGGEPAHGATTTRELPAPSSPRDASQGWVADPKRGWFTSV